MSPSPLRAALALALLVLLAAPAVAPAAQRDRERLYVSLGDSYAVGYQPREGGGGSATRNGYADRLPQLARRRGYRLRLVNFGCGGETTRSVLERTDPCAAPAVGGPRYAGRTQVAAATRLLRRNRGRVALITVSIGGNDLTACATAPEPVQCAIAASARMRSNVTTLGRRLRAAAGRDVSIVGLTYPVVTLAGWVTGDPARRDLARQSIAAFRLLVNPALATAYRRVDGRLVDVTAATDAYVPFEKTTTLAPYGVIPVAVARLCQIAYTCSVGDIHLKTSGYHLVAGLVAKTLPRRRAARRGGGERD